MYSGVILRVKIRVRVAGISYMAHYAASPAVITLAGVRVLPDEW